MKMCGKLQKSGVYCDGMLINLISFIVSDVSYNCIFF